MVNDLDMLSAKTFAKVGKCKKAFAWLRGVDICPLCGCLVKPIRDCDMLWSMECRNPRCYAFMNIESDLWDTKEAAFESYKRAVGIFTRTCALTCKCRRCGGVLKQSERNRDDADTYGLRCINCGESVKGATEIECIKAWNAKNHFDIDADFLAMWFGLHDFGKELVRLEEYIREDKATKHRG